MQQDVGGAKLRVNDSHVAEVLAALHDLLENEQGIVFHQVFFFQQEPLKSADLVVQHEEVVVVLGLDVVRELNQVIVLHLQPEKHLVLHLGLNFIFLIRLVEEQEVLEALFLQDLARVPLLLVDFRLDQL